MKCSIKRLRALLEDYPRVAIAGGPKAGKTTLTAALELGRRVLETDAVMALGWSESSQNIADEANKHEGPLIVEGVAVPRALRKGMRVDCVVWLDKPHVPLKAGQAAMAKGCKTVLNEWRAANPDVTVVNWEAE